MRPVDIGKTPAPPKGHFLKVLAVPNPRKTGVLKNGEKELLKANCLVLSYFFCFFLVKISI